MTSKIPNFFSFFMGGFECTYALNSHKKRLDLLQSTRHDSYCHEDYRMIKEIGIKTVREGLAWSLIDKGNQQFDFSRFEKMMQIAKEEGIEQIWDLNHFDFPEYLEPFTDDFITSFSEYGKQCVKTIRKYFSQSTLYIVPWNEISFFSLMGGDLGIWAPYKKGIENGVRLKRQLVKASIAVMEAIWEIDKNVRFIQVDPLMRRIPKDADSEVAKSFSQDFNNRVRYEAWDMLSGKVAPELGGNEKYLDIVGVNYYFHNQEWIIEKNGNVEYSNIPFDHPDRISFAEMLEETFTRYHRPIVITETGSWGELRSNWWKRILQEIDEAKSRGIPIAGVCAYPIIDRHDWDYFHLTNSGLWDFENDDPECRRIPHPNSIEVIRKYIYPQSNH